MRMVYLAVIAAVVFEVFVVVFAASADKSQVRALPKWVWVLICLLPIIGGIAYLLFGRPISNPWGFAQETRGETSSSGQNPGAKSKEPKEPGRNIGSLLKDFLGIDETDGYEERFKPNPEFRYQPTQRKGPVAPDDDPEFLRQLDKQLKAKASGEAQAAPEHAVDAELGSDDEPDTDGDTRPGAGDMPGETK